MKIDWLTAQKLYGVPGSIVGVCLTWATADPTWCTTPTLEPIATPIEFFSPQSSAEGVQHNSLSPQLVQTPTESPPAQPPTNPQPTAPELDLSPEIIESSPVLQRWRRQLPNVLRDIRNNPSFRTRIRFGYSQFPSTDQAAGLILGVEDVLIGRTRLTLSGDYQASFNGKREAVGADLRYYLRPLGSYVNIAPVVGYRHLESERYSTDGLNLGARVLLVLSRGGAADLSLTQSWVSPGTDEEVGLTTLSVGYALTRNLRLSTDIQKQNARQQKDSRVGIVLEWMP